VGKRLGLNLQEKKKKENQHLLNHQGEKKVRNRKISETYKQTNGKGMKKKERTGGKKRKEGAKFCSGRGGRRVKAEACDRRFCPLQLSEPA